MSARKSCSRGHTPCSRPAFPARAFSCRADHHPGVTRAELGSTSSAAPKGQRNKARKIHVICCRPPPLLDPSCIDSPSLSVGPFSCALAARSCAERHNPPSCCFSSDPSLPGYPRYDWNRTSCRNICAYARNPSWAQLGSLLRIPLFEPIIPRPTCGTILAWDPGSTLVTSVSWFVVECAFRRIQPSTPKFSRKQQKREGESRGWPERGGR